MTGPSGNARAADVSCESVDVSEYYRSDGKRHRKKCRYRPSTWQASSDPTLETGKYPAKTKIWRTARLVAECSGHVLVRDQFCCTFKRTKKVWCALISLEN